MQQDEKEIKRARNTAYRYLTLRPRSRREVEKKLDDRGFPRETVRAVLGHLERLGYINDALFARQWAASRMRSRGFGKIRIAQELRAKGIERDVAGDAVQELFSDVSETEIARREAAKKLRTLARLDPAVRRRRLAGFLERKGYSSETIRAVLHDTGAMQSGQEGTGFPAASEH